MPRKPNPWNAYIRTTCSSGYRAQKAKQASASKSASKSASTKKRKRMMNDGGERAKKIGRIARRMIVKAKRKRAADMAQESGQKRMRPM